jgi:hypothetical protein
MIASSDDLIESDPAALTLPDVLDPIVLPSYSMKLSDQTLAMGIRDNIYELRRYRSRSNSLPSIEDFLVTVSHIELTLG